MTDFPSIFQAKYSCALLADAAFRAGIPFSAAPHGLTPMGIGEIGLELMLGNTKVKPGDWAFGDADGVIFIGDLDHLSEVFEWAERSYRSEEFLAAQIRSGVSLGELLNIEAFVEERAANPQADFNQHISKLGQAI